MSSNKSNNKTSKKDAVTQTVPSDAALNSGIQENPIAIVGMASVFADSKSIDQYWDNILDQVDSIIDIPESRWNIDDYYSEDKRAEDKTYCKRGAFMPEVDFDPMEFGLPPNILEVTDIAQLMALIVAKEALADAGLAGVEDLDHVGITLGVGSGLKQISSLNARLQYPILDKVLNSCGVAEADKAVIIDKFKKAYIPWEENSFPGMLGNVIAGRVANRFNLGGTNCTVDAACAGSLAAMKLAVSDLLEGRSDAMISGGICCDNSPFMYMSFSKTPAFTTNETIRPFDEDSKGMMVGEGAGMIVMKRLADAERDGDKIYAVLKGIGSSSDGKFKSIYAPRPDGQAKALKRAYDDAGFDPKTVGLIEGHGTGTLAGDAAEFGGLTKFFGEDNDKLQHIALGSVKSQIGHTKSAAGAAGFIKLCLALHHKVLPATINVDKPSPTLNIEETPFYLNTETRPWVARTDGAPRRAGVSSFGFGGTNFHFVLEEYKPAIEVNSRLNNIEKPLVVSAANEADLTAALNAAITSLKVEDDNKAYAFNALLNAYSLRAIDAKQVRIGFVAKNADDAVAVLEKAVATLVKKAGASEWSLPMGVHYRSTGMEVKGKVAALFSGQGSQYVNMAREVACSTPEMLSAINDMDSSFANAGLAPLSETLYPIPVFSDEDRKAQAAQLQLTQFAQPAIGTVSVGLFNTLKTAGLETNFTAGHSFGELTALWAAGVISQHDYMMLARARGQAMAAPDDANFDAGTMVAVVAEPAKVEAEIKELKGVSVANYNSKSQVVIAGETQAVNDAHDMLKDKGYKVVKLPVSAAFHTPLVGHAQKPFAEAIKAAKFSKPAIPVFSNASGAKHSEKPADIQKAMQSHILESVRFDTEIDAMYEEGARVFIEFGPKNVLSKLVENILADKGDVVSVALNANPKKPAEAQMRSAIAQLAVIGFDLSSFDPYAKTVGDTVPPKKSPMAMKLSAASYVSPKTQQAFTDALNDGYQIASGVSAEPEVKVVEKIVEKVVEVEKIVEKIVYVDRDGGQTAAPAQAALDVPAPANIEQQLSAFYQQQQQLLNVHQQFMAGPENYSQTVQGVLNSNQGQVPAGVAKSLEMYHDFQSDTLKVHEQFLQSQTAQLNGALASDSIAPVQTAQVINPAPVVAQTAPVASAPAATPVVAPAPVVLQAPKPVAAAKPAPVKVEVKAAPAPVAAPAAPSISAEKIQTVMMDVVAEKTGYPTEMLELGMDMEADLGIDSIKRVEILGSVQDELPGLPELNPEDLAELRTLGQIVDYMNSKLAEAPVSVAAPAAAAAPGISAEKVQSVMMDVVAEKTGYPTEMLELGMDMEADLGIDSIKRVEILGSVQDELPGLPELNPEDLAELRTLGQIVDYMNSKMAAAAPLAAAPVAAAVTGIDPAQVQSVMMTVVAEKTGYPTEMLELGMDMEADLGIDSIKRVEILGSVQDELPGLPELNPEDLAELRTLGQIVDYMNSKLAAAAPLAAAPVAAAVTGIDPAQVQSVMMTVVAEKTGYPTEMLELGMDMEADLGIDSIKRVEILGAVQDELPGLPELNPEDLAELRTLGQIVDYMNSKLDAVAPAPVAAAVSPAASVTTAPGIDPAQVQAVMMAVVADKTGYPSEMLELGMDMEADLGIDSIKRVEILGAVQDELPGLPELNPEDLAELRTLGQIVDYMKSKLPAGIAPVAASAPAASVDMAAFSQALIEVVAEKTGYPKEMLELDMDMEADLGIDSIKRVEILGAVQDALPGLPEVDAETLAEMRTLQEITTAFTQSSAAPTGAVAQTDQVETAEAVTLAAAPTAIVAVKRLPVVMKETHAFSNVLIVDDGNGVAIALSEQLVSAGAKVAVIKPEWVKSSSKKSLASSVNVLSLATVDEAALSAFIQGLGQLDAVFTLAGKVSAKALKFTDNAKQSVLLSFLIAKHCSVKTSTASRPAFIAMTRQGGQFGFEDAQSGLIQGGVSGLVKTLKQEWDHTFCRTVDVANKFTADKTATMLLDEVQAADSQYSEVGYDDEGRLTLEAQVTNSFELEQGSHLNKDSVLLVSGGAKGVTAHCVIELAKKHQCQFILLGRSAFDASEPTWAAGVTEAAALNKACMQNLAASGEKATPMIVKKVVGKVLANREIAGTIAAIQAAGGQAHYASADVTKADEIKAAIKASGLGAVTGIIHGAGVLADKFIEDKTVEDFDAVYNTKIAGFDALLNAVDANHLTALVMFSSAAGFYGNPGQSDYSIANDILNKISVRFKQMQPNAQVLSFNWGPWDGGMVTPELKKMFAARGVYIIPLDTGASILVHELCATDNRSPIILVGNDMSGDDGSKK